MDDRRGARSGAVGGIAFVALVLAGFFFPAPPPLDAPVTRVSRYYIEHQDSIHVSLLLFAAAAFFFLWFLAALRDLLSTAEGGSGRLSALVFGSGLLILAVLVMTLTFVAGAAFRPEEASPELTRALHDLSFLASGVGAFAVATFFAAVAVLVARTGCLPAWLGTLAGVTAIVQALGAGSIFTDTGRFAGDDVISVLGLLTLLAWVLGASVVMLLRPAAGPVGTR